MNEEIRKLLKLVGSAKTVEILEYLREHGTGQHRDFNAFTNTHTLNTRLIQLIKYKLIEHHYKRHDVRIEWYTLTERGEHILAYVDSVAKVIAKEE